MTKFAYRRVTTMCSTCVGFYVYRGRRYEHNDTFLKLRACRPRLCCGVLAGPVGSRLAGWLHPGPLQ